jgi:hypothetical protein
MEHGVDSPPFSNPHLENKAEGRGQKAEGKESEKFSLLRGGSLLIMRSYIRTQHCLFLSPLSSLCPQVVRRQYSSLLGKNLPSDEGVALNESANLSF